MSLSPLLLLLACTSTPDDSGSGGDAADGGASDGGASDGGSEVSPGEWVQIATEEATGADVEIAPDGTIYVAWLHGEQVLMSVSTDRGQSFGAPFVAVADGGWASGQTHPNLAVAGDRIALAAPSSATMRLYLADRATLDFADPVLIGVDEDLKYETIFLTAHAAPDGSFWTALHAFPSGSGWSDGWKGVAREATGWVLEPASTGAPGEPCECCPHDLAFAPTGEAVLAFRNNIDNIRDTWVARSDAEGAFAEWSEGSEESWEIGYCPEQGPRVSADGAQMLLAWPEASTGPWRSHTRRSEDGGLTWGPVVDVPSDDGLNQRSTTVVLSGGRAWLGSVSGYQSGARLSVSADAGDTWTAPVEVVSPDGRLEMVELGAGGGLVAMVGAVEEGGGVWLQVLHDGG